MTENRAGPLAHEGEPDWLLGGIHLPTVKSAPQATALIIGQSRQVITYARLEQAIATLSTEMIRNGLIPGDVVALRATNSAEFVVGLLAAARAGLVTAPIDPSLPEAETTGRLETVGARVLLSSSSFPERNDARQNPTPVWLLSGTAMRSDRAPRSTNPPSGLRSDDALLMFTSGTTALPKLVPWTNSAIGTAVAAVVELYGLSDGDATVAAMPLFHGHGLIATLLATLASGGRLLMPAAGRFTAHTFWDDMAAVKATWYTAVPTIHQILVNRTRPGQPDVTRGRGELRFIRSCSAPLAESVVDRLESTFGTPVLPAYGMTEATHHITGCAIEDDVALRRTTVGAASMVSVRVVGPDRRVASPGVVGEIQVSGPTVTRGYVGDGGIAANATAFDEQWLLTGDLGSVDRDGHLTVVGRVKTVINRGGEKISPEHVEQVLAGCPGIEQAAVFGRPDPLYGERVSAAVVLEAHADATPDVITDYCRDRLPGYEIPDQLTVMKSLPVTDKGDIDRVRLARIAAGGMSSVSSNTTGLNTTGR